MDGWMEGFVGIERLIDEQLDGWMKDGWKEGQKVGRTVGWKEGRTVGWMDGWNWMVDGRKDGWKDDG
jgi:hypothetical protein